PAAAFGPGGAGRAHTYPTGDPEGIGFDLGDLFGDVFGRGRRSRPAGPRRGRDLEAELRLGFEQAVFGATAEVQVTSDVACAACGGSGARPGTTPATCTTCGGSGVVAESQGLFSMSRPCPACAGRGRVVADPCPACGGRGAERRPRRVRVRIPAGVQDGQVVRLPGRGEAGRHGGPPGDLFVTVRVGDHPVFGRSGRDLTVSVPVTYPEAALGAEVKVPTLDGGPVTVRIPPGTPSGRTLRVRGHGVPGPGGRRGDLLVTVEVAVPRHLSAGERQAVEALATAMDGNPRAHLGV
ncbi:MAG: DnaJ C-terminal domain-containing protein, partial [Acidimicrobiia bacterium]